MSFKKEIFEQKAEILKALAHPVRLCIVCSLLRNGGCNATNMETCLEVSQSGISQHLSKLKAAGIIKGIRCGNEIRYVVESGGVKDIIDALFKEENDA